jgi:hypothetical protein
MVDKVKDELNKGLKNSEVLSHEEVREGVHELEIDVRKGPEAKELAFLSGKNGQPSPLRYHEGGRVITRDFTRRVDLDLLDELRPGVLKIQPQRVYQNAIDLYKTAGQYGTVIDTLTNFASKGFKNDVDDPDIKLFYDTWNDDIGFQETVEKIFFDFFRVGMVRTFKTVGKFDPRLKPGNFTEITNQKNAASAFKTTAEMQKIMADKEFAAAKKIWSKSFVPINYTILNPSMVIIDGPLMFDQTETLLKPEAFSEVREMMKNIAKASAEQRSFISKLPKELKDQIQKNKPVKLPRELVGKCDYRKQDYERYPLPRLTRAMDSLKYKDSLQKADYSTLDGITNYILKITIGNDTHPVTSQSELETVAALFDTPSKSFDIVWNHTLDIEKVTFPEISQVLGQEKFMQVNDDLSQAYGVTRALLDGTLQGNAKSVELAAKAFSEEVNYARRCVRRWINNEYEEVALAMGFDRYPIVRFDENALKDEIMMMSVIQGMIDRRIISYESGIEKLGMDFNTELANMKQEAALVQAGILGIIGSPYNPKALPSATPPVEQDTTPSGKDTTVTKDDLNEFQKNIEKMVQENVQKTQRTPKGTPSEGRPRGAPAKTPKKAAPKNSPRKKPRNRNPKGGG